MTTRIAIFATIILAALISSPCAQAQISTNQVHAEVEKAGGVNNFVGALGKRMAEQLPLRTNRNVEMVSATGVGNRITSVSRLLNIDKKAVTDMEALRAANSNFSSCHANVLETLIQEYGTELVYVSVDRNGKYLFEHRINKTTCSEN